MISAFRNKQNKYIQPWAITLQVSKRDPHRSGSMSVSFPIRYKSNWPPHLSQLRYDRRHECSMLCLLPIHQCHCLSLFPAWLSHHADLPLSESTWKANYECMVIKTVILSQHVNRRKSIGLVLRSLGFGSWLPNYVTLSLRLCKSALVCEEAKSLALWELSGN